jgi:hypothetical protein
VEARTPPLQGERGFAELRIAFDTILANGGYVTERDGLHVHHDAPEFVRDPKLIVAAARSWKYNEGVIENLVHPRRHNRGACPRIPGDFETYDSYNGGYKKVNPIKHAAKAAKNGRNIADVVQYFPRGALNLGPLTRGQGRATIEIRLHEGTLDYDVAEAWIRFGQWFLARAATGKRVLSCPDPATLLRRLEVEEPIKERLLARSQQLALA